MGESSKPGNSVTIDLQALKVSDKDIAKEKASQTRWSTGLLAVTGGMLGAGTSLAHEGKLGMSTINPIYTAVGIIAGAGVGYAIGKCSSTSSQERNEALNILANSKDPALGLQQVLKDFQMQRDLAFALI